jgi:hypothetical protein
VERAVLDQGTPPPGALERFEDVDDLREHVQGAIELEHSTLPPDSCAGLYTLGRRRRPAAAEVIRSVFVDEMLHLTLAANLLNAVGGQPRLHTDALLPGYGDDEMFQPNRDDVGHHCRIRELMVGRRRLAKWTFEWVPPEVR